jgi:hypothetical protein
VNTCSAFTAAALMDFLIRQRTGQDIEVSEAYTYWAGKNLAPENDYVRNLYRDVEGLAGYLAVSGLRFGTVAEEEWPYAPAKGFAHPPEGVRKLPYRAEPIFIEREQIGAWMLAHRAPVAMNINWYQALVNAKGDFTRLPTAREARACAQSGAGCGGHVILLSGYDSSTHRFIFRNSWGPSWGNSGYGTLPEELVVRHCEVCAQLPNLGSLKPEEQDFLKKASQGVSAELN